MTEPDVALTDYLLTLECGLFAVLLQRRGTDAEGLRPWFVLFFASASAAPLFGGTVHGFFLDAESFGHAVLWPAALLCIGVTAFSGWVIGARLLFSKPVARWFSLAAATQLLLYAWVVVASVAEFRLAILVYVPAALFLLVAFCVIARSRGVPGAWLGAAGLLLTFVAALLQQLRVSLHPVYFTHNSVYHVVQAAALCLVFLAARSLLAPGAPRTAGC